MPKVTTYDAIASLASDDILYAVDVSAGVLGSKKITVSNLATSIIASLAAAAIPWAQVSKVGSNLTDLVTRSHTVLSDIGTNTHAQIDTRIAALTNVENIALSTWAGSTNLTTLGTITTGTWQGTAIAASYVGDLAASKITSGTFDNARVNWAAPGAIGATTPAAGTFTTLKAVSGVKAAGTTQVLHLSSTDATPAQLLLERYVAPSLGHSIQSIEQTVGYLSLALNPAGGRVLVGTAADDTSNLLQINGSLRIAGTTLNANLLGATIDTDGDIVRVFGYKNTGGAITLWTNASGGSVAERMRITSAGNVGIGTADPDVLLVVAGSNPVARVLATQGSIPKLRFSQANIGNIDLYMPSNVADLVLSMNAGTTEHVRVTSGGLVGIGCTPLRKFHLSHAGACEMVLSHSNADEGKKHRQIYNNAGDLTFALANDNITEATTHLKITAAGGVIMPTLPTTNPAVAGALWNDSGTVKISAG